MTAQHVRQARRVELPAVLGLATAFYIEDGFATPVSQLRENLLVLLASDDARVAVVCGADDNIVGFAITTLSFGLEQGHVAELEDLYVHPAHRRTGIAGALIGDSVTWAQTQGCRVLELVIASHGDEGADLVSFYVRHGFSNEVRQLLSRDIGEANSLW